MPADQYCFPQLNNSCKTPTHPHDKALLIYVLLSFVSLFTVLLNLLVIISISHFRQKFHLLIFISFDVSCTIKQLHTPTNLLLLSLAVSDLFVGLLLMPVEIIYVEACWFLGDILCTLYYVADYIITSASVASMVLISIDRYVAVCYPFYYSTKVTSKRVKNIVYLCWLCSILYRIVLLNDHLEKPGHSSTCLGECVVVINNLAGIVDLIFTFIIPITIIIVLYVRVFVVVLSVVRTIKSQVAAATARPSVARKMEIKAASVLGVVVLVFLICFCPYYFPTLAGEDTSVNASFVAVEIWLAHFNSCLNPVIYVLFYPWFRKCIRLILTLQIFKPGSCNAVIIQ